MKRKWKKTTAYLEENDEDITFTDQRESLIVQRNLSVACGEEVDDWLQKNYFLHKMHISWKNVM